MILTGTQCKAARELLGWSFKTLESQCKVGASTIRVFELGERQPKPFKVMAIRRSLEAAGVEFIAENRGGVRLRE